MTAICSVGLDMIAIPEVTPAETIAAMIADEAAIGVGQIRKATAVRIIPWARKAISDYLAGFLGTASVMKGQSGFVSCLYRPGGQIPAPSAI